MSLVSVKKKGYLHKLPVKGFVKKWNRRWFVLHCTTIEGIVRLEYFDSESFEATAMGKRTIPLRQCRDLAPAGGSKTHPYVFQFSTPMGHHVFAAESHTDMEEWMSTIQEVVMEDRQRNRRKKTQSLILQQDQERPPAVSNISASGTTQVPLTVNQMEATAGSDPFQPHNSGTYRVTLELNESAQRLGFTAMIYNLEITPDHITLVAADSGADIAQWSYRQIRTYGKSSGKFNFECGRLTKTGPGNFVFKTTCSKEIFGVVHHNIKRIRRDMEEEVREKRAGGGKKEQPTAGLLPKQASLPEQSKPPTTSPPAAAAESVDYRTHQPAKPIPYKPKKKSREEPSLSVGTYRLSREFGNPPSYEEISAAYPIKEEEEEPVKPTSQQGGAVGEEKKVPEGLYSTVDKSKKKKKTQGVAEEGEKQVSKSPAADSTNPPLATNDPFFLPPASSSPLHDTKKRDTSGNPFQLDPFLFSPQPGADSFDLAPGTDPFTLPPLPTDTTTPAAPVNLGPTVFDDLGQLDSSTGGGLDSFNFDLPLPGAGPSANGASNPPPLTGNPMSDASNPSGLNFDLDLLDDRLFDTLAQLEVQDGGRTVKEDLGKPGAQRRGPLSDGGSEGQSSKTLSQREFDNLWDGISAAIPTVDS